MLRHQLPPAAEVIATSRDLDDQSLGLLLLQLIRKHVPDWENVLVAHLTPGKGSDADLARIMSVMEVKLCGLRAAIDVTDPLSAEELSACLLLRPALERKLRDTHAMGCLDAFGAACDDAIRSWEEGDVTEAERIVTEFSFPEIVRMGSHIRHIKRGSCYQVIDRVRPGRAPADGSRLFLHRVEAIGGGHVTFIAEAGITMMLGEPVSVLPVMVQVSDPDAVSPADDWLLYRSTQVDDLMFLRPEKEFTPDRFTAL